ncbi:glycine-rich protein-like [Punica granatum]|uniref:Glycine-rich protein-like n=1 Tax=Punica granatum TaxID=22663 RepID=A0A218X4Z6_PUNGR|nr:glycine-rich protein-like [Punica granatum]OWM79776.1 hypothetical protein CDL15_Pgr023188 [Punica granatum]
MSSRVFLLLGLLAAIVLLLASDAAARDLAETTSTEKNEENGVDDAKYSDGRGGYNGQYPGGGYGGGLAKGCRHGCCKKGKFKYAKCIKCCASAAEAAQMATEVKPQN